MRSRPTHPVVDVFALVSLALGTGGACTDHGATTADTRDTTLATDTLATDTLATDTLATDTPDEPSDGTVADTTLADTTPDETLAPTGPVPRYEPSSADWTARPWPSDRLRANGHVDFTSLPFASSQLATQYAALASEVLDGFSLSPVIYFQFDRAFTPLTVPFTTPRATLSEAILLDLGSGDAHGRPVPFELTRVSATADGPYLGPTLGLRPIPGTVLRDATPYCAILTTELRTTDGATIARAPAFAEAYASDPSLAPLRAFVADGGIPLDQIAVATCFTTQSVSARVEAVVATAEAAAPPTIHWTNGVLEGEYQSPVILTGAAPYLNEGGDIVPAADGRVAVQGSDTIGFAILRPSTQRGSGPARPVVVFVNADGMAASECAPWVGDIVSQGWTVLCIDAPFAGRRASANLDPGTLALAGFNFGNPRAARGVRLQETFDLAYLLHAIASGAFDQGIAFDTARVGLYAHEGGAEAAALGLGYITNLQLVVLSGVSGFITQTLLDRRVPLDLHLGVAVALDVDSDALDGFHPACTLVQALADIVDPMNFAARWSSPTRAGVHAKNVLLTVAGADTTAPLRGAYALTAAARAPFVGATARQPLEHRAVGIAPVASPARGNLAPVSGGIVTLGAVYYPTGDHYAAYYTDVGAATVAEFFGSYLTPPAAPGMPPLPTIDTFDGVGDGVGETAALLPSTGTCASPMALEVGTTYVGSTAELESVPSCSGLAIGGEGAAIFRFAPTVDGMYSIAIDNDHDAEVHEGDCDAQPAGGDALFENCTHYSFRGKPGLAYTIAVRPNTYDAGAFALTVTNKCTADCSNVACGGPRTATDLCYGIVCGTCADGTDCVDHECQARPTTGVDCASATPISTAHFAEDGALVGYPKRLDLHDSCFDFAGRVTHVLRFTAPEAGAYTFTASGASLSLADTCQSGCTSDYTTYRDVLLAAGESRIVVLSSASDGGTYHLAIDRCEPHCDGVGCGSDGCFGVCGSCTDGKACVAGACEVTTAGETCDIPLAVSAVPFHLDSAVGARDDVTTYLSGRGGLVTKSTPDRFLAFTAPAEGGYTFSAPGAELFDVDACAGQKASFGHRKSGTLGLHLLQGETALVAVESAAATTLDITTCTPACGGKLCGDDGCGQTCGACAPGGVCDYTGHCVDPGPGDSCEAPYVVEALPFSDTIRWAYSAFATAFYAPDIPGCDGAIPPSHADAVLRVTPTQTGAYAVTMPDSTETVDVTMACGGACIAPIATRSAQVQGSWIRTQVYPWQAGQTYFVEAREGASDADRIGIAACTPICGARTCGPDGCGGVCGTCATDGRCDPYGTCAPSGPGVSCDAPAETLTAPGTTVLETYAYPADTTLVCRPWALGPAEHAIVQFVAPVAGDYAVSVAAAGTSFVFVGARCGADPASCRGESGYADGTWRTLFHADAGEHLFIDAGSEGQGPVTLTLALACEAACDGKTCGADGCGGSCGTCAASATCEDGACVATAEGACAGLPTLTLDAPVSGSTAADGADHFAALGCDDGPAFGLGTPEDVWTFTPSASGSYAFYAESADFAVGVYVLAACEAVADRCTTTVDSPWFGALEAAHSYDVVVDGFAPGDVGTYSLRVVGPF